MAQRVHHKNIFDGIWQRECRSWLHAFIKRKKKSTSEPCKRLKASTEKNTITKGYIPDNTGISTSQTLNEWKYVQQLEGTNCPANLLETRDNKQMNYWLMVKDKCAEPEVFGKYIPERVIQKVTRHRSQAGPQNLWEDLHRSTLRCQ